MADVRLIDANALAQRFSAMQECANMRDHVYLMGVLSVIDNAPTIDAVEVVHARWNTPTYSNCVDTYGNPDTCAECSVCGFRWNSEREAKCWFHYCPDCGAKMDGKEG